MKTLEQIIKFFRSQQASIPYAWCRGNDFCETVETLEALWKDYDHMQKVARDRAEVISQRNGEIVRLKQSLENSEAQFKCAQETIDSQNRTLYDRIFSACEREAAEKDMTSLRIQIRVLLEKVQEKDEQINTLNQRACTAESRAKQAEKELDLACPYEWSMSDGRKWLGDRHAKPFSTRELAENIARPPQPAQCPHCGHPTQNS